MARFNKEENTEGTNLSIRNENRESTKDQLLKSVRGYGNKPENLMQQTPRNAVYQK